MENKIIFDQYIMYGLNRRRAFLDPPTCEDCGGKGQLVLEGNDLREFCLFVLTEHDCEYCALFFVHKDETYEAYFKSGVEYNEETDTFDYHIGRCRANDRHMFSELDGEFKFCCYSLLLEVDDNTYEVCR